MNTKKEPEERKNTFTKSIMSVVVLLYFIGATMGTALIILAAVMDVKYSRPIDVSMFIAYAAYLGTPTAISIGCYAWKSKAENVLKIAQSFQGAEATESIEVMDILSKMGGN
jgi:hypothetical protein